MSDTPWQILVADDDQTILDQISRMFNGSTLDDTDRVAEVLTTLRIDEALEKLSTHKIDILILDLRQGGEVPFGDAQAGNNVMKEIKKRRFVPVVFYTGIPHRVEEKPTEVLRIVTKDAKGSGLSEIQRNVREIFETGIPAANRAIMQHVEQVQRDFMWQSHGLLTTYKASIDKLSLAYMMARRLSASLEGTGIEDLARNMGYADPYTMDGKKVHPMCFYRIPANPEAINTGGLYLDPKLNNTFWVVLTNACDLDLKDVKIKNTNPPQYRKERKAQHILLAACVPLTTFPEYKAWTEKPDDKSIRSLIGNHRAGEQPERWSFFLPSGVEFPDMLVDFQHLRTVSAEELAEMLVLANIDSPFLESLISKFIRFYARVGTPDLDTDLVLNQLNRPSPDSNAPASAPIQL